MRYVEEVLGYAFELPEGGRQAKHLRDRSAPNTQFFTSGRGLIRLTVGEIENPLRSLKQRKLHFENNVLDEARIIMLLTGTKPLGREKNVIYAEYDQGAGKECIISAVHGERHFLIQFEGDCSQVDSVMSSFEFLEPDHSRVTKVSK